MVTGTPIPQKEENYQQTTSPAFDDPCHSGLPFSNPLQEYQGNSPPLIK
jgi:hypothetical protein